MIDIGIAVVSKQATTAMKHFDDVPVLATLDTRSKTRKETASEKLSRHLLGVKMARKRNGERRQWPSFLDRISKVASTGTHEVRPEIRRFLRAATDDLNAVAS
jgi:hypothetical protein